MVRPPTQPLLEVSGSGGPTQFRRTEVLLIMVFKVIPNNMELIICVQTCGEPERQRYSCGAGSFEGAAQGRLGPLETVKML